MDYQRREQGRISGGYYIKARRIKESAIAYASPYIREIFDWILREANHQNRRVGGTVIRRGQCLRTYEDIRNGLAWKIGCCLMKYSKDKVKKAMQWLRKNEMITTDKAGGGVFITVCNYHYYQNPGNYYGGDDKPRLSYEDPNEDPHDEATIGTTNGTTNNRFDEATIGTTKGTNEAPRSAPLKHQGGPTKNKKVNNGRNKYTSNQFEKLWNQYPNKIGRKEAFKHFKASVETEEDWVDVNEALSNYKTHLEDNSWKSPQNGSTWFNNWHDWVDYQEPMKVEAEREINRQKAKEEREVGERVNDLMKIQKEDPDRCQEKLKSLGDTPYAYKIKSMFKQKIKEKELAGVSP